MTKTNWTHVFVVYRYDSLPEGPIPKEVIPRFVTIKEVLSTDVEAQAEVERLNRENADKECVYFYQRAKFYPDGR